ncbi:MAG: hypothetical protein ACREC6_11535, partial [Hyphomicrobiaceae bacterium]
MSRRSILVALGKLAWRFLRRTVALACAAATVFVCITWLRALERVMQSEGTAIRLQELVLFARGPDREVAVLPEFVLQPSPGSADRPRHPVSRSDVQNWHLRFSLGADNRWRLAEATGRQGFPFRLSGGGQPERRLESLWWSLGGQTTLSIEGPDGPVTVDIVSGPSGSPPPAGVPRQAAAPALPIERPAGGRLTLTVSGAALASPKTFAVEWRPGGSVRLRREDGGAKPDIDRSCHVWGWHEIWRHLPFALPVSEAIGDGFAAIGDRVRRLGSTPPRSTVLLTLGGRSACKGYGEPSRLDAGGLWSHTLAIVEQDSRLFLAPGVQNDSAARRAALATLITVDGTAYRLS